MDLQSIILSELSQTEDKHHMISFICGILKNDTNGSIHKTERDHRHRKQTYGSVQFSRSVLFNSFWPRGLQHSRLPCPSATPGACSNSCPSSPWYHPTTSSSVIPFSSCLQSCPSSGSFPVSQFFISGGQSIGVSASASILPMNIQDWSPLGWTGWISLQSNGLSRVFSNTTVQKHQFFGAQLSLQSNFKKWKLNGRMSWILDLLSLRSLRLSQWFSGKEFACSAGDTGLIPGSGRSPGVGNSNPLQYSCLENPMNRGAWWVTVHRVANSQTWLKWLSMHIRHI